MNTFNDKLFEVVKEVEEVKQTVSDISEGSTNTNISSSQISDRITDYVTQSSTTIDITPDESIFEFSDEPVITGPYEGRCTITCANTITFILQYKDNTFELKSDTASNQDNRFEDIIIYKRTLDTTRIYLPVSFDDTLTLKFTNIKDSETPHSDTTILVHPPKPLTNMSDDKVMTANAINQYTAQFQKTGELVNRTYPVHSIFFTTEDLNMDQVAQKLGGGQWGVLHTNLTDSDSHYTIYAWIRTG